MVWLVLVASTAVIFGVAIYGITLLVGSYKLLKRQRSAFYEAKVECQEKGPKDPWNVSGDTIVGKWIQICKNRFDNDLVTPLEVLKELSDSILEKSDNLIRTIVNALIVIGLSGTFIGLVISVSNTFSIVQEIQQSELANPQAEEMSVSEAVQQQFNTFLNKLKPVLGGMSLAFITSIVGLSFSLGLSYCFSRYSLAREEFRAGLVQFADEEFLPIFTPPSEKYIIGEVIQDSLKEIQQKFDDTNKVSREHIQQALQDASQQNKNALSEISGMMEKTLDETTDAMQANYQKLSIEIENLAKKHIRQNQELTEVIMGDRSQKKEDSNRGLLGSVFDILSLILGEKKVEEKYLRLKEEEERDKQDSVMDTVLTSIQKVRELEKEAERKVKASRFKYENTFLEEIWISAHVISQRLRSICEESDFQEAKIKQELQDIQKIELVDILSSEENIKEFFENSVDSVIEDEKGTYRWIIQKFWDRYSKVFILKQRIDNYELKRESPSESKELLQKLSDFLDLIGTMVQELFKPMGITPTPVFLFDEFDSDKHSEGAAVRSFLREKEFRSFLRAKIREGSKVDGLIVDILSWGYESKLEGLQSTKPKVVYYHDTESNRKHWFGDLAEYGSPGDSQ